MPGDNYPSESQSRHLRCKSSPLARFYLRHRRLHIFTWLEGALALVRNEGRSPTVFRPSAFEVECRWESLCLAKTRLYVFELLKGQESRSVHEANLVAMQAALLPFSRFLSFHWTTTIAPLLVPLLLVPLSACGAASSVLCDTSFITLPSLPGDRVR